MSASSFYVYVLFRDTGVPFYVGKGAGERWKHHERKARRGARGRKCSIIRGMLARGTEVPIVKIHEGLIEAVAHAYETALISAIGRHPRGPLVNLTDGGDGVTGFKHPPGKTRSPEHVVNLAAALRGKKLSPEHIAKRSAARRGKKLSAAARANIGAGQRGRKKSAQECANISAARLGSKASPEARANMSAARLGKPRSPAQLAAIERSRGKKMPPEAVAKRAEARRGIKRSADICARISAGKLAASARRRASLLLITV